MYINLLLYTKEHICRLTLSNLNVCDIPVSMKPSYLVAPVHIIDFYIQTDFEALSDKQLSLRQFHRALFVKVPVIHKL